MIKQQQQIHLISKSLPIHDAVYMKQNMMTTNTKSPVPNRIPVKKIDTNRCNYRKTSNISCTLVGDTIVALSDVVGASPVSAPPTTS